MLRLRDKKSDQPIMDDKARVRQLLQMILDGDLHGMKLELAKKPELMFVETEMNFQNYVECHSDNHLFIIPKKTSLIKYCLTKADNAVLNILISLLGDQLLLKFFETICETFPAIDYNESGLYVNSIYQEAVNTSSINIKHVAEAMAALPRFIPQLMCMDKWPPESSLYAEAARIKPDLKYNAHHTHSKKEIPLASIYKIEKMPYEVTSAPMLCRGVSLNDAGCVIIPNNGNIDAIRILAEFDARTCHHIVRVEFGNMVLSLTRLARNAEKLIDAKEKSSASYVDPLTKLTRVITSQSTQYLTKLLELGGVQKVLQVKYKQKDESRLEPRDEPASPVGIANIQPPANSISSISDRCFTEIMPQLCNATQQYLDMFTRSPHLAEKVKQLELLQWRRDSIIVDVSDRHTKEIMLFPVKLYGRAYCLRTIVTQFRNSDGKYVEPSTNKTFDLVQINPYRELIKSYDEKLVIAKKIQDMLSLRDAPILSQQAQKLKHLFEKMPALSCILAELDYSEDELEERGLISAISMDIINYPVQIQDQTYDIEDIFSSFQRIGEDYLHPETRERFRLDQVACNYDYYEKYITELERKVMSAKASPAKPAETALVSAPAIVPAASVEIAAAPTPPAPPAIKNALPVAKRAPAKASPLVAHSLVKAPVSQPPLPPKPQGNQPRLATKAPAPQPLPAPRAPAAKLAAPQPIPVALAKAPAPQPIPAAIAKAPAPQPSQAGKAKAPAPQPQAAAKAPAAQLFPAAKAPAIKEPVRHEDDPAGILLAIHAEFPRKPFMSKKRAKEIWNEEYDRRIAAIRNNSKK